VFVTHSGKRGHCGATMPTRADSQSGFTTRHAARISNSFKARKAVDTRSTNPYVCSTVRSMVTATMAVAHTWRACADPAPMPVTQMQMLARASERAAIQRGKAATARKPRKMGTHPRGPGKRVHASMGCSPVRTRWRAPL
jgi:hypothetical protein